MIFALVIVFLVSRFGRARSTRSDFYTGDRIFTPVQNGLALFGTAMMTSFLVLSGEIALKGYEGVLLAVGCAMSWLVTLVLVAEPLRNTGTYTLGDALSVRMRKRTVRVAAATLTLVVFFFYMTTQLISAGSLVAVLIKIDGPAGRSVGIATVGCLTAMIVHYGGMRGTIWTQIVNAVLLFAGVVVLAMVLLAHYRFNVSGLLGDVAARSTPDGQRPPSPGARAGLGPPRLELVSPLLTTVLGNAALPYLFIRFLRVPSARDARRSVSWAIWLTTPYYLLVVLIGLGAAAVVGPRRILSAPGHALSAVPLLASETGGVLLLVFIASIVYTTITAVTAGLVIGAAASFTRDIYATVVRSGPLGEEREIKVARRTVVALCALVSVSAVVLMNQNAVFMMSLAVTLVASSVLPALLFSWFWRGFNTVGALWSMYGGLAATLILMVFSPAVSGEPTSMLPNADFAYIPGEYVGLVSLPVACLLGYAGARLSTGRDDAANAEMEVRALTGAGAVEARPANGD